MLTAMLLFVSGLLAPPQGVTYSCLDTGVRVLCKDGTGHMFQVNECWLRIPGNARLVEDQPIGQVFDVTIEEPWTWQKMEKSVSR